MGKPMSNLPYIEALYREWRKNPAGLSDAWDSYFREAEGAVGSPLTPEAAPEVVHSYKQSRVDSMLWAYRSIGYVHATLNPLGGDYGPDHHYLPGSDKPTTDDLALDKFGLSEEDLDTEFFAGHFIQPSRAPLRDIIAAFRETYCSTVGVEFLHIQDLPIRQWLIERMESTRNRFELKDERRRIIMEDLLRTQSLEKALSRYFTGQKRFSIAGSESVVSALHFLVDSAYKHEILEIAVGTTHRGRLSILNTILEMSAEAVFSRFEETHLADVSGGSGDVKYHIGYDTYHVCDNGHTIHMRVPANASHLESTDGVVEGLARGLQDQTGDIERKKVLPVLLHGDAAFAGQGVVAETLNLSQLEGYGTGGTIHIIINNQIGFTTSAHNSRSSVFPTDVAKAIQSPIIHVNGDDPEAAVHAVELALEFRQEFGRDVVIDIFCFRRFGHNEGDDPSFTHPYMYRLIKEHPGVTAKYGQRCDELGVMSREEQEATAAEQAEGMKAGYARAREQPIHDPGIGQGSEWDNLDAAYTHNAVETGVPEERLRMIGSRISTVPDDGFHIHPRLKMILDRKRTQMDEANEVDWSMAEAMAVGSLLLEDIPVRFSGEDTSRGTFSQRHFVWWDVSSELPVRRIPLNRLSDTQAKLYTYDSPLSEYSALAFEYGYSLVRPHALVVWEAQFGDFANGAQVTIDNYIAAAEAKWGQRSGLVLLLPHGQEGQGPDHSSARPERFLQLCAENNIEVCNATTPAQYFHLLLRQQRRPFRKPLIVMAPKSLLRHPKVVSPLTELVQGSFMTVLQDPTPPASVDRVLMCSGKLYYDLAARREEVGKSSCAIIRFEQLYPFPAEALEACLREYPDATEFFWVQEETRNAGAWTFMLDHMPELPGGAKLGYIGRAAGASAATGLFKRFERQQKTLTDQALGLDTI
jgi:2-oxoglutarate dehydrogenase E1 component